MKKLSIVGIIFAILGIYPLPFVGSIICLLIQHNILNKVMIESNDPVIKLAKFGIRLAYYMIGLTILIIIFPMVE